MMRACVYARKSTDETDDRSVEAKSVAIQEAAARAYAEARGWTVVETLVDDAISGAEFGDRRPGLMRLLTAVGARPRPFDVVLVRDRSRIGREAWETGFTIKRILRTGCRIVEVADDREVTITTPDDKLMLMMGAFADEHRRYRDARAGYDTAAAKARAGFVTGCSGFGYRNTRLDGRRGAVTRQIEPNEAAVVQRIFAMSAAGAGLTRIAKTLNAERALAPTPKAGRPPGWNASTVRTILHRSLYTGHVVWGVRRKRNAWGESALTYRPAHEWVTRQDEALRIVSDDLWAAAHRRFAGLRQAFNVADVATSSGAGAEKPTRGRRRDADSPYLLSGHVRCGVCGGAVGVVGGSRSSARGHVYGCLRKHKTGLCANTVRLPLALVDDAVLTAVAGDVLRPQVVRDVIRRVVAALMTPTPEPSADDRATARRALADVEQQMQHLTAAIAAGGSLPSLLAALTAAESRAAELRARLTVTPEVAPVIDVAAMERDALAGLQQWRALLSRQVAQGRQFLREADVRLVFTPGIGRSFRFTGQLGLDRLVAGRVGARPTSGIPVRGFEPRFQG